MGNLALKGQRELPDYPECLGWMERLGPPVKWVSLGTMDSLETEARPEIQVCLEEPPGRNGVTEASPVCLDQTGLTVGVETRVEWVHAAPLVPKEESGSQVTRDTTD